MITPEQEKWLAHLPNDNQIWIYDYDPEACEKFEQISRRIKLVLGNDISVELHGSVAMGILGQGELDIDIPVTPDMFYSVLAKMESEFGKPGSVYPLRRARFVNWLAKTKAEIILVNKEAPDWVYFLKLEKYLVSNPREMAAYIDSKKAAAGLSTQGYYRKKIEFFNGLAARMERFCS